MSACFDRELCVDPFLVESDGFVDDIFISTFEAMVTHSFLFEEVVKFIACDRVGDDGRVWIFLAAIRAAKAMIELRAIGLPFSSTALDRSTSVSKIKPRSA